METILQQVRTLIDTGELVEGVDYRNRDNMYQFDQRRLLAKLDGDDHDNIRQIEATPAFEGFGLAMFFLPKEVGVGFRERKTVNLRSSFLTDAQSLDSCNMYCDKDSRGRYSIMELSSEDYGLIRMALINYRVGLVFGKTDRRTILHEQYDRIGVMLHEIEKLK